MKRLGRTRALRPAKGAIQNRPPQNRPVRKCPNCRAPQVLDLSPLKGLPLKWLYCNFPERDAALLRSIKTLETINGKPAAEFWKEVEARKQP
jgi:hypothetical protein